MSLQTIPQDTFNLIYHNYLAEKDIFSLRCTCKLIYDQIPVKKIYYNPTFQGKLMIKLNCVPPTYRCRFISSKQKSIIIAGLDYQFHCYTTEHSDQNGRDEWIKTFQIYVIDNNTINTSMFVNKSNCVIIYKIQIIIN
jgi:hypothetical protein